MVKIYKNILNPMN